MKKEIRTEGTAFTRRRRAWVTYDVRDEADEGPFVDRMERLTAWSKDPWAAQQPLRDWVERELAALRAQMGTDRHFVSRVDTGWYLEELQLAARIADENIAKGNARWAAYAGAKFGELWSELQLKLAREELYLAGKKQRDNSAEGISRWRKGTQAERVREVDERPKGMPKSLVFRRIAKREGVTAGAIETDYYKAKKNLPNPHD